MNTQKDIKEARKGRVSIKKILFYSILYFILPLFVVVFFYQPIFKIIKLQDATVNLDSDNSEKPLAFSDKDLEISKILGQNIPIDRHQICINNKNRVYLIHSDNELFKTPDISQMKEAKEEKVGAMSIVFHYFTEPKEQLFYSEIGQKNCYPLETSRFGSFASSTMEYRSMYMNNITELDLGDNQKLTIGRTVGNSFVDTSLSRVYIMPLWKYFFATWLALILLWLGILAGAKKFLNDIKSKRNIIPPASNPS